MSTIKVNTIQHSSGANAAITLATNGAVTFSNNVTFASNVAFTANNVTIGGNAVSTTGGGSKNKIINGDFSIWQRGTSFTSNDIYTADRWWHVNDAVGSCSVTRVDISTLGFGATYCLRAERTAGTNRWVVGTNLETTTLNQFRGKNITLSFKMRKGSALTSDVAVALYTGATEARYGNSIDGATLTVSNSSLNTSTFTTFSQTIAIPAGTAALGIKLEFSANQTGASGAYFDITDVQLEEGSFVTPFERRLYGQELTLCQRYYWRNNASATWTYARQPCTVVMGSTTGGSMVIINPVPMRSIPVSVDFNALALYDGANLVAISNLTLDQSSLQAACMAITTSGATALRPYIVMGNNSASSYLGISAEL